MFRLAAIVYAVSQQNGLPITTLLVSTRRWSLALPFLHPLAQFSRQQQASLAQSASQPPRRGVAEGGGEGAMSRRAIARAQHLPSLSFPTSYHLSCGTSLAHRKIGSNHLTGGVPTQLAALTALELLCARPAPRRGKAAARGKGQ